MGKWGTIFGIKGNPIPIWGADCAHHITCFFYIPVLLYCSTYKITSRVRLASKEAGPDLKSVKLLQNKQVVYFKTFFLSVYRLSRHVTKPLQAKVVDKYLTGCQCRHMDLKYMVYVGKNSDVFGPFFSLSNQLISILVLIACMPISRMGAFKNTAD